MADLSARFLQDAADCFFNSTVTVHTRTDQDSYGKPSFSATTQTVGAYIEEGDRLIINPQGEEEYDRAVIYLDEVTNITTADDIELPDGSRPPIIRVEKHRDETGSVLYEVVVVGDQNQGPRKA